MQMTQVMRGMFGLMEQKLSPRPTLTQCQAAQLQSEAADSTKHCHARLLLHV